MALSIPQPCKTLTASIIFLSGAIRDNSGFSKAGGAGGSGIVIVRYPLQESQITPLLLKGDGINNSTNIIDSSANNFTVTVNGNAK